MYNLKIEDFIKKLDATFTNPECEDFETLEQGDFKFYIKTELDENGLHPDLPVQVVAHVSYKGQNVAFWGCDSTDANRTIVEWWAKKKAKATRLRMDRDIQTRKEGIKLFDKL